MTVNASLCAKLIHVNMICMIVSSSYVLLAVQIINSTTMSVIWSAITRHVIMIMEAASVLLAALSQLEAAKLVNLHVILKTATGMMENV